MIALNWKKDEPVTPGAYFVAITLGQHLGEYGVAQWANSQWEHAAPETILAWVPIETMVATLPPALPLKWRQTNPLAPDWGFLLTESGILFADWDGSCWQPTPQTTVLGSATLGDLLAKCQFNWPGTLVPLPTTSAPDDADLANWEEVPE